MRLFPGFPKDRGIFLTALPTTATGKVPPGAFPAETVCLSNPLRGASEKAPPRPHAFTTKVLQGAARRRRPLCCQPLIEFYGCSLQGGTARCNAVFPYGKNSPGAPARIALPCQRRNSITCTNCFAKSENEFRYPYKLPKQTIPFFSLIINANLDQQKSCQLCFHGFFAFFTNLSPSGDLLITHTVSSAKGDGIT